MKSRNYGIGLIFGYNWLVKIQNTLTKKPAIIKASGPKLNFYTCGPTVYDYAHIGNLRSFIFADVLFRALKAENKKVRWVMNLTDVDDKTIRRTIEKYGPKATNDDLRKYTDFYIEAFKKDLRDLNVSVDEIKFVRVSDSMDAITKLIKTLLRKGYAYKADDGVYFSISKYQKNFKDYGALVGKNFLKGKEIGARVKVDEYDKKNLSDFALWKKHAPADAEIFWNDPVLGPGRPGWHVECSAINAQEFKNKPTDIHTGGIDLVFPHHTNEIAQSQPAYKPFVKTWAHCEHLLVDGRKMAKSEGNIYTLKDLESRGIPPLAYRYLMLGAHYRSKLNFTWESLEGAASAMKKLETSRNLAEKESENPKTKLGTAAAKLEKEFQKALQADLNTSAALAILNKIPGAKIAAEEKAKLFDEFEKVLGIISVAPINGAGRRTEAEKLAQSREEFRRNKQFIQADDLRKKINELGFEVLDTPQGPVIQPK